MWGMPADWKNKLFFGDNLAVLRKDIPNECVDLIYRGSLWITSSH
jgi:DNA modification methylase